MKFWIVASAASVTLGFAFAGGHVIRGQFLGQTSEAAAVDSGIVLPAGYRDWRLISVAAVGPPLNDVRAKLGNDVAIGDLQRGTIPYRDGAIIARLAWKQTADPQTSNALRLQAQQAGLNTEAIGKLLSQSFIAGAATNVQLMVKDSKIYSSTGGWGFAQFTNGKADPIVQQSCFACHAPAKDTDFVFTHYAP